MPLKTKKTQTEAVWDKPRNCRYCEVTFRPLRPQDKDSKFCTSEHRKAFYRYRRNEKVVAALKRDLDLVVRRRVAPLEAKIERFENLLREVERRLDVAKVPRVTLQHTNGEVDAESRTN